MAQHDYVIANGTGAAVRSDLNNALAAIVSQNSGATEPATTYAYQWWADTTTGLLKLRNGANNAWITLFQLDGEWSTLAVENGSAAAPSIYFKDSGTDTGIYSPGADQVGISTGGTSRFEVSTTAATSTLPVVHPLGAVGTPSITFTGDLNTGIYSPAADTIAFAEGGVEAMRIDSNGDLLSGTTSNLGYGGRNIILKSGQGYAGIASLATESRIFSTWDTTALPITFFQGGTERMRLDSSNRLLVGTSTSQGKFYNGTSSNHALQVEGSYLMQSWVSNTADSSPAFLTLAKSRGSTPGSVTAVNSGDSLGLLSFQGGDGSEFVESAQIKAEVDGTPGANDMPGRLVFSTTADGASSPTERMRIDSTGLMTLAGPGIKFPATQVASADPNTLDDYEEGTWTPTQEANLTVVGTFSSTGRYLKIGRQVFAEGVVTGSTSVAVLTTNAIAIGGLPFTPGYSRTPGLAGNETISASATFQLVGTTLYFMQTMAATTNIRFVVAYSI